MLDKIMPIVVMCLIAATVGWFISLIKNRETWFSTHKALIASILILAISISGYLWMQERTRKAQNEQAPAKSYATEIHFLSPDPVTPSQPQQAQPPAPSSSVDSARERHFNTIRSAHPDYDQIVAGEDIRNWILEQPPILREEYVKAWDQGSAGDMIKLVTDYKRAKRTQSVSSPRSSNKYNVIPDEKRRDYINRHQTSAREKSSPTMQKWVDEKGNVHYSGVTGEGQ